MNITEVLKRSLIFSSLGEEELGGLSRVAVMKEFAANSYLFWEGDPSDQFYIVSSGRVKVIKSTSQGKDLIVAFFGTGEMFGEVAVFGDEPYPASAQALEPTTVLIIKRADFLAFLSGHPQMALRIINMLGGRLRDAQDRIRDLVGERVEQRLARILLMLSAKLGPDLPFTRQEIADMAGTTVETSIRFMSRLKDGGIITSTRGKVHIVDERKLRLISEGVPG